MKLLESLPEDHEVRHSAAYAAVKKRNYVRVPRVVAMTPPEPAQEFGDADFSPEALEKARKSGPCASPGGARGCAPGSVLFSKQGPSQHARHG